MLNTNFSDTLNDQFCCDILCPEKATHKIIYSKDLGEFGYTFSCSNHLETLKMDSHDETQKL